MKKESYQSKIKELLSKTNLNEETITKKVRELNSQYNQNGYLFYNKRLEELKKHNYPTEIFEKIKTKFQQMYLSEFYENENNTPKETTSQTNNIKDLLSETTKNILYYSISDFDEKELNEIDKEISSYPFETQKELVKNNLFNYFKKPSKELIIYAIKNNYISLNTLSKNQRTEEIDILAATNGSIYNIKSFKDLSTKARLAYIKNNPQKIITQVDETNWNTLDLTIYDLNKKELEIYKNALEEYQINLVKENPNNIKDIKNPSTLVKNYAVSVFRQKYER